MTPEGDRELPDWLAPIRDAAGTIRGEDLSRFLPPADAECREGAVLMLFGEGPEGPDLLLTERAHDMRSHPGQISFPGGSRDPGDASSAACALREAQEETGLDPAGVEVLGTLPELWLPPSNFAVTTVLGWWRQESPVAVVDPAEVRAVLRVPLEQLLDPTWRVTVERSGYSSPGFLVGPEHRLILWGFTAGLVNQLFDYVGLTRDWDRTRTQSLPDYMLALGEDARADPRAASPSDPESER